MAPPSGGYSYAGNGSDKHGSYKVFTKSLTGLDEVKNPIVWVKVTRDKRNEPSLGSYDAEYLLFHIDCPSLTYTIAVRIENGPDGRELSRKVYTPQTMTRRKLPDPKNNVTIVEGVSSPEMHAAGILDQDCKPFA